MRKFGLFLQMWFWLILCIVPLTLLSAPFAKLGNYLFKKFPPKEYSDEYLKCLGIQGEKYILKFGWPDNEIDENWMGTVVDNACNKLIPEERRYKKK